MSDQNATLKVRNRKVEIKWVSQYCDHILSNFIQYNKEHDLTFQQIANLLKTCRILQHNGGRIWFAFNEINGVKYKVVFILSGKFAVVVTCYRHGYKES